MSDLLLPLLSRGLTFSSERKRRSESSFQDSWWVRVRSENETRDSASEAKQRAVLLRVRAAEPLWTHPQRGRSRQRLLSGWVSRPHPSPHSAYVSLLWNAETHSLPLSVLTGCLSNIRTLSKKKTGTSDYLSELPAFLASLDLQLLRQPPDFFH